MIRNILKLFYQVPVALFKCLGCIMGELSAASEKARINAEIYEQQSKLLHLQPKRHKNDQTND